MPPVADVAQAQRWLGRSGAVRPEAAPRIEVVLGQEPPAVSGDEVHRLEDEIEHRLRDEVVEVDPDPPRLDPLAAAIDLALELVRLVQVDPQQPVPVRPCARTATARLDAE